MPKRTLHESFRMPHCRLQEGQTTQDLLVRARTPTLKKLTNSSFSRHTFSFSRFLERQSRLSYKKAFSSLELYFFRLKKQKELFAVRRMTILQPTYMRTPYPSESPVLLPIVSEVTNDRGDRNDGGDYMRTSLKFASVCFYIGPRAQMLIMIRQYNTKALDTL